MGISHSRAARVAMTVLVGVAAAASSMQAQQDLRGSRDTRGIADRRKAGIGKQYDRAALDASGANNLEQFLSKVPNVTLRPAGTFSEGVRMRRSGEIGSVNNLPGSTCHVGFFLVGHRMDR